MAETSFVSDLEKRHCARNKTSSGVMSEWQGRTDSVGPVTQRSKVVWEQVPGTRDCESSPYQPFEEPGRQDEFYKRYLELSRNVAHKYPNQGPPVTRQGRVGATWRHIKEVQGYDSRVVYVDGLVRIYDTSGMNPPSRCRRLSSRSAALSTPLGDYAQDPYYSMPPSEATQMPPINKSTVGLPGAPSKYKGFYSYKH